MRIAVLVGALVLAAPASADVLVDQTDHAVPYSSIATENASGYHGETADDFTVPAGAQWSITEVDAAGDAYGVPSGFHVRIYADAGGLPGALEFTQDDTATIAGNTYTLPLNPPAVLGAGSHWLAVQSTGPNISDEWFWIERSTQTGSPAAYRDVLGTSCTTWTVRTTCDSQASPDQIFALTGTSMPAPTATPSPSPGPTPTATATATPTASPTPAPVSSAFTLGKAKRKRATVRLKATVPSAGTLKATAGVKGKRVGKARAALTAAGSRTLVVKLSKRARKRLRHHKLKVVVRVSFTANGGTGATTLTRRITLKPPRHHKP